jgi:hypothetical protein
MQKGLDRYYIGGSTHIGLKMTTQAELICQSQIRWDMQSGLGSQVFEVIDMTSYGYAE